MSYPLIIRQRAIEQYQEGVLTQEEVAATFRIHLSTFKRWLRRERSGEGLEPIEGNAGRPGKIDEMGFATIERIVQENPSITLEELSEVYKKFHGVYAGRSILSRALKKMNLRYKKLSVQSSEKSAPDVKKKN